MDKTLFFFHWNPKIPNWPSRAIPPIKGWGLYLSLGNCIRILRQKNETYSDSRGRSLIITRGATDKCSYQTPFLITCFIAFWGCFPDWPWSNLKIKKKIVKKYSLEQKLPQFEVLGYRQVFCRIFAEGQETNIIGPSGRKLRLSANIFIPTYSLW